MKWQRSGMTRAQQRMDLDLGIGGLMAGLVLSSIGFGLFLFGKKQRRAPQLAGGVLLMVLPIAPCALWIEWLVGAAICGGVWLAARAGW